MYSYFYLLIQLYFLIKNSACFFMSLNLDVRIKLYISVRYIKTNKKKKCRCRNRYSGFFGINFIIIILFLSGLHDY